MLKRCVCGFYAQCCCKDKYEEHIKSDLHNDAMIVNKFGRKIYFKCEHCYMFYLPHHEEVHKKSDTHINFVKKMKKSILKNKIKLQEKQKMLDECMKQMQNDKIILF